MNHHPFVSDYAKIRLSNEDDMSEETINKRNRETMLSMENGFHQFYRSFGKHLAKLRQNRQRIENQKKDNDADAIYGDNDIRPLSLSGMTGPFIVFLFCISCATIMFVIEHILFFVNKIRSRRIIRPRNQRR